MLIRVILLAKTSFLLKGVGGKISFHFLTIASSQERALVGKSSVTFCPWFHRWLSGPRGSPQEFFPPQSKGCSGCLCWSIAARAWVTCAPPSSSGLLGPSAFAELCSVASVVLRHCTLRLANVGCGRGRTLITTGWPRGEHPPGPQQVCWLSDLAQWGSLLGHLFSFAELSSVPWAWHLPGRLCLLVWSLLSGVGLAPLFLSHVCLPLCAKSILRQKYLPILPDCGWGRSGHCCGPQCSMGQETPSLPSSHPSALRPPQPPAPGGHLLADLKEESGCECWDVRWSEQS